MPRTATSALLVAACALSLTLGVPVAHADAVLDGVSGAIDAVRSRSGCQPLASSNVLDSAAQNYVRSGVLGAPNYPGVATPFIATGQTAASATTMVMSIANGSIKDCKIVDVGVSSARDGEDTVIGIVLGSISGPQGAGGLPQPK